VYRLPLLHGACPYGARHFNWGKATIPAGELNPDTHYLGNRPRPSGSSEKCTFCIQRPGNSRDAIRPAWKFVSRRTQIRQPARPRVKFANCSNISGIYPEQELNTEPKFFYFYES